MTGACPCASAWTHDRGLCEFTRQPPLENVENGRDMAEIVSILIHLRENLHSGGGPCRHACLQWWWIVVFVLKSSLLSPR